MSRTTILKAKTHFSRLVKQAEAGREVVIMRGDVPVARLVPYRAGGVARQFGALKGLVRVTPDFFDPLSASELAAWDE